MSLNLRWGELKQVAGRYLHDLSRQQQRLLLLHLRSLRSLRKPVDPLFDPLGTTPPTHLIHRLSVRLLSDGSKS